MLPGLPALPLGHHPPWLSPTVSPHHTVSPAPPWPAAGKRQAAVRWPRASHTAQRPSHALGPLPTQHPPDPTPLPVTCRLAGSQEVPGAHAPVVCLPVDTCPMVVKCTAHTSMTRSPSPSRALMAAPRGHPNTMGPQTDARMVSPGMAQDRHSSGTPLPPGTDPPPTEHLWGRGWEEGEERSSERRREGGKERRSGWEEGEEGRRERGRRGGGAGREGIAHLREDGGDQPVTPLLALQTPLPIVPHPPCRGGGEGEAPPQPPQLLPP